MAEIIDNIDVFGEMCPIWTVQANGGHHVFITNKTNRYIRIRFEFSGDFTCYLNTLDNTDVENRNSVFGIMIHGVSFKKNFDISIWELKRNGDAYDDKYISKTITWN